MIILQSCGFNLYKISFWNAQHPRRSWMHRRTEVKKTYWLWKPNHSPFLTHLLPFFSYSFSTAAQAVLCVISSALCFFLPRLFSGFWYCSIAPECTFSYICCACSGKESICFFVLEESLIYSTFSRFFLRHLVFFVEHDIKKRCPFWFRKWVPLTYCCYQETLYHLQKLCNNNRAIAKKSGKPLTFVFRLF